MVNNKMQPGKLNSKISNKQETPILSRGFTLNKGAGELPSAALKTGNGGKNPQAERANCIKNQETQVAAF